MQWQQCIVKQPSTLKTMQVARAPVFKAADTTLSIRTMAMTTTDDYNVTVRMCIYIYTYIYIYIYLYVCISICICVYACRCTVCHEENRASLEELPQGIDLGLVLALVFGLVKMTDTHRLQSSSFLGLPYRIRNISHKKELLWSLWVNLS